MNIDLKVDGYRIQLGMPFNEIELSQFNFSKLGLLMKLALRAKISGDIIYWSKNPEIYCFDEAAKILPLMDSFNELDLFCGSSVFLYFNNGALRLVVFQAMKSFTWAQEFTREFREAAKEKFGNPDCLDFVKVKTDNRSPYYKDFCLYNRWYSERTFVMSRLSRKGDGAVVIWGRYK